MGRWSSSSPRDPAAGPAQVGERAPVRAFVPEAAVDAPDGACPHRLARRDGSPWGRHRSEARGGRHSGMASPVSSVPTSPTAMRGRPPTSATCPRSQATRRPEGAAPTTAAKAVPAEGVDRAEHPEAAAVGRAVRDGARRPAPVRSLRDRHRRPGPERPRAAPTLGAGRGPPRGRPGRASSRSATGPPAPAGCADVALRCSHAIACRPMDGRTAGVLRTAPAAAGETPRLPARSAATARGSSRSSPTGPSPPHAASNRASDLSSRHPLDCRGIEHPSSRISNAAPRRPRRYRRARGTPLSRPAPASRSQRTPMIRPPPNRPLLTVRLPVRRTGLPQIDDVPGMRVTSCRA